MKLFIDMILGAILGMILGCLLLGTSIKSRFRPIHKGVDPKIQSYVNDYRTLANKKHIYFAHTVTVGFTDIKRQNVIGICWHGSNFREIDIDSKFWESASDESRKSLIFHELTHCYCGRDHDFGPSQYYPDLHKLSITGFGNKTGYMTDGCPLSIMHPIIISDYCMDSHYTHYMKEMWDRCNPW